MSTIISTLMAQISRPPAFSIQTAIHPPIMDTIIPTLMAQISCPPTFSIQTAIQPPIMSTIISKLMEKISRPPTPVSVVSPNFVVPNSLNLRTLRNLWSASNRNVTMTDEKGNVMLKVKQKYWFIPWSRLVLLDASGTPILSVKQMGGNYHSWVAFRGDSSDKKDIIFSVKRSSPYYLFWTTGLELDVFLGCNRNEQICDFKVKSSWRRWSATIYAAAGDFTILAQMHKKFTLQSLVPGRDTFSVINVNPNVDYAFIVALAVILAEINRHVLVKRSRSSRSYKQRRAVSG